MPLNDLMIPLLKSFQDNDNHKKSPEPIDERHVQFREQLTDSDEPNPKPHHSKPLKSALKVNNTEPSEVEAKEITMEPSTAAIIRQIQQKYDRRKPLLLEKQALKSETERLSKEAACCQKVACGCCATGAVLGAGLVITAIATATCGLWNAAIAVPFCLTAYFCKKGDGKEKSIIKNHLKDIELTQQLAAPENQIMRP
jgi:hypothetical protein